MQKKIAVLVGQVQDEALRMGVGITLEDDVIDIYVLDKKVEPSEKNDRNIFTTEQLEMDVYSNSKDNEKMQFVTNAEIAKKLLEYDLILPY